MNLILAYEPHHTFGSSNSPIMCKLHKSIYDLKQAARQWYSKLSLFLIKIWFIKSKSDYLLFTKGKGVDFIAVLVYADDIIVVGPNHSLITSLKENLDKQFRLKDMGNLKYFLGLELTRSNQWIVLIQWQYTLHLLQDVDYLRCKSCNTPMDSNTRLRNENEDLLSDTTIYSCLIGCFIYLTY